MQAEIITIGDEILIGQVINSNAAFIAQQLNKIGVSVHQITSIADEKNSILKTLKKAERHSNIIIITGGLGPTKDDITKNTLTKYFNDTLVTNTAVLKNIKSLWKQNNNAKLLQVNIDQALVPKKAEVLMNLFGTAPGLWIEKENKTFIALPGVPFEMEALIKNQVLSKIQKKYTLPHIIHKTIVVYGIGESTLASRIEDWENQLPKNIKLAYLPNFGKLRLRLSGKATNQKTLESKINKQVQLLLPQLQDLVIEFENLDQSLEEKIAAKLTAQNQTLAIAESCTGGKISEIFTANAGASTYFKGSIVSYATATKIDLLKISKNLINKHGIVSAAVAEAMASNVIQLLGTNYAIATTGNAGPTKGDINEPVGTIFIAIAKKKTVYSEKFNFGKPRIKVINKATNKALEMLWKEILKNSQK